MFRKRDVRIHFVGIGGIGMSGIAEVLLNLGYHVSGSDMRQTEVTRRLATLGAKIGVGHDAGHAADADVVVVSTAVPADNPEVVAARKRDVPVIPRAEMLGELMRVKDGVAVAGSHGKTTTTTMIATVLAHAGLDPTVIVGGKAQALGSGARLGHGEILVAEADESDGSFRHLIPMVAIVTNVDREHMDHYGTMDRLRQAFVDFANQVPFFGLVVLCADDPTAAGMGPDLLKRHVTYGLDTPADYRGEILEATATGTRFRVSVRGKVVGEARLNFPGVHYARNALGAFAVTDFLDVSFQHFAEALASFQGVDRRFSVLGEVNGALVVDDYGHHPTEIAATIAAARLHKRRLVVAFQPHRFTRTRDVWNDFAAAFRGADEVWLTDIYAAGEAPIAGIDAAGLLRVIAASGATVHFAPRAELGAALGRAVGSGDLLLTLGAGDITQVGRELVKAARAAAQPGR